MHHKDPEKMFSLTRRKASTLWQVRKRWPSDVSPILVGEFTRSTGESDRKRAQAMLPALAAEYERRVQEARDRLADNVLRDLSKAEMHRLAAKLFADLIPMYQVNRSIEPVRQNELIAELEGYIRHHEAALGRRDYGAARKLADGVIDREGLPVPAESPSREEFHRIAMLVQIEVYRQALARLRGAQPPEVTSPELRPILTPSGTKRRTVEDLLDAYVKAKRDGWSKSTEASFKPVHRLLQDALGTREVASLTREDARTVQALVKGLPSGLGRRADLKGLTVPQAVEQAARRGLPTIAAKTANDGYLVHITALFAWAMVEEWAATNPFQKLAIADPVDDIDRRDPFSIPQLQKLFSGQPWAAPQRPDGDLPGRYWIPLLGLFQGARLGELAGLRVMDIEEVDDVWSLHIRPHGLRDLKTEPSRRRVPVHPEILRMGFAAFVKHRREAGSAEALLFPDVSMKDRGQIGYNISRWFGMHVRTLGLTDRNLSFHSLRHSFEDALKRARLHGTPEGLRLAGRAANMAGSGKSYGSRIEVELLREPLSAVTYPGLDLEHLVQPRHATWLPGQHSTLWVASRLPLHSPSPGLTQPERPQHASGPP